MSGPAPTSHLPSQRVLITGSNRGIGRVTARYFASRGARVAINGRDLAKLGQVKAEFAADGLDVITVPGDISDPDGAVRIVQESVSALGGLDVLVNNAAVAMRGRFDELKADVVARVMDTNVTGTVAVTLAALDHLKRSRGSVVFVSSLAGIWGFPLISVYAASKMALTAIVQSMRSELHDFGVHVGIVHVGITQHDAGKAILSAGGSPYPLAPRPTADTQQHVARVIYRMVRRRRARAVLTPAGRLLDLVVRFFPRLLAMLIRAGAARVDEIAK